MLPGSRECPRCCRGQWAAVRLPFVRAQGRVQIGAPAPQRLGCPGSWVDIQKGSRARGHQVALPARGPLASALDAGLAGWPGHFINLSNKIPEEGLLQS